MAVMVPMALVGAVRYHANPAITLDLRIAAMLACGAVVGAYVGAGIAAWASGAVLRRLFAIILAVVAVQLFRYKPPSTNVPPEPVAAAGRSAEPGEPADA